MTSHTHCMTLLVDYQRSFMEVRCALSLRYSICRIVSGKKVSTKIPFLFLSYFVQWMKLFLRLNFCRFFFTCIFFTACIFFSACIFYCMLYLLLRILLIFFWFWAWLIWSWLYWRTMKYGLKHKMQWRVTPDFSPLQPHERSVHTRHRWCGCWVLSAWVHGHLRNHLWWLTDR